MYIHFENKFLQVCFFNNSQFVATLLSKVLIFPLKFNDFCHFLKGCSFFFPIMLMLSSKRLRELVCIVSSLNTLG